MKIAICARNEQERAMLQGLIEEYFRKKEITIVTDSFQNRVSLIHAIRQKEYQLLVLAKNGVEGMETAIAAKQWSAVLPIIWISDLDFSIEAYRIRVEYFLLRPVSRHIFFQAIGQITEVMVTNEKMH